MQGISRCEQALQISLTPLLSHLSLRLRHASQAIRALMRARRGPSLLVVYEVPCIRQAGHEVCWATFGASASPAYEAGPTLTLTKDCRVVEDQSSDYLAGWLKRNNNEPALHVIWSCRIWRAPRSTVFCSQSCCSISLPCHSQCAVAPGSSRSRGDHLSSSHFKQRTLRGATRCE